MFQAGSYKWFHGLDMLPACTEMLAESSSDYESYFGTKSSEDCIV